MQCQNIQDIVDALVLNEEDSPKENMGEEKCAKYFVNNAKQEDGEPM